MTRERDRIQENANKYIVKNCPAIFYSGTTDEAKCWQKWEQFNESCQSCTDCVIKQVIDIAKDIIEKDCYENSDVKAEQILQLFNIEEVKE